jgi:DNA-binding response OmpR family regulator
MQRVPTLLIVENHRDCREVLAMTLEMAGYHVVTASTGSEALARLRGITPQDIVLDTALPDRDVLDVVRVLRANARFDGTSIVVVSTWFPPARAEAALAAGADALLLKPFGIDHLLSRLSRTGAVVQRER